MPNILAHSHVTAEVLGQEHPDISLGSVLPDFVGMYKDRTGTFVQLDTWDDEVNQGIELHIRTDITYDHQPEKHQIVVPLAAHFEKAGLKKGAARLGAAFLGDVMVDGALLDSDKACHAFEELARKVVRGKTALSYMSTPPDFNQYVTEYFKWGLPLRYANPEILATILQERLSQRAKTDWAMEYNTFQVEKIANVAEVIDIQAPRIGPLGVSALKRTIAILRDDT